MASLCNDVQDPTRLISLMDNDADGKATVTEKFQDGNVSKAIASENNETKELEELVDYVENAKNSEQVEEMKARKMFDLFDKNRDGFICPMEMKEALTMTGVEVTDEEVDAIIQQIDEDGNGLIDYEEFKIMLCILNGVADCDEGEAT